MKRAATTFVLFASLVIGLTALAKPCGAAFFERIGQFGLQFDTAAPDVRSRALGGAVVAIPSGPVDLWWNPAALPTGHAVEMQYAAVSWPPIIKIDLNTLAVAGEWRNVRLGLVRTTWEVGPELIRTAYEPEGNGTSFHTTSSAWTFNAGTDLARWILPAHPRANLAVGVNVRRLASDDEFAPVPAVWDADLGLLAAQRWQSEGAWCRLRVAGVVRNAFGSRFMVENFESRLMRELRAGFACEVGMEPASGGRIPVRAALAYGRTQNLDGFSLFNQDHLGLELTLFDLFSPRVGHADISSDRSPWSYGCGLHVANPGVWPVGLRIDYAREDWGALGGWRQQWAAALYGDFD